MFKINAREYAKKCIRMAMEGADKVQKENQLFSHIAKVSTTLVYIDQEYFDEDYLNTAIEYADKISNFLIQQETFHKMIIQLAEMGYIVEAIEIAENKLPEEVTIHGQIDHPQETAFNDIAIISAKQGNIKQILHATNGMLCRQSRATTLLK